MSHSCPLCLEVATVVVIRLDHNGNVLHDSESVAFQADTFHGIVSDEANFADSHLPKYLGSYAVFAFVGTEAEMYVGIDRIVALLLELVGGNLVHEPDASTFLAEIDDEAFAFFDEFIFYLPSVLALACPILSIIFVKIRDKVLYQCAYRICSNMDAEEERSATQTFIESQLSKKWYYKICPNCGAPVKGLGDLTCSYCGSNVKKVNLRNWEMASFKEVK